MRVISREKELSVFTLTERVDHCFLLSLSEYVPVGCSLPPFHNGLKLSLSPSHLTSFNRRIPISFSVRSTQGYEREQPSDKGGGKGDREQEREG